MSFFFQPGLPGFQEGRDLALQARELLALPFGPVVVEELLAQLVEEAPGRLLAVEVEAGDQDREEQAEDVPLPLGRHGGVDRIVGVLLQVDRVDELALEEQHVILQRGALLADDLHHLVDLVAPEEDVAGVRGAGGVDQPLVFAPAFQGMDGGILAGVGALAGKSVKGADHLQGRLGHRLVEVAAGRADRAADGDRAAAVVAQPHQAGPLVEAGDDRFEVGGERLLPGDLLQAARHLAQGLGPARGRVGQQQDVQPHLPVVFGQGDGGIDRSLAGGDRHGAGVADDDGALHQGAARPGVGQLGEFLEGLDDLAGPLAAGGDDDDVDLGVAARGLLQDGLAGPERPGDAVGAAAGDGDEGVDDADLGDHRLDRAAAARGSR